MGKILVTGGTVFASRFVAEHFALSGNEVYVLNRNTKIQPEGTILIEADRHKLGNILKEYEFETVLDITAYTKADVADLVNALGQYGQYIMLSSSAVYPETEPQPFREESKLGANKFWGAYGTNKIEAERELLRLVPDAYILRPPYLYGEMNNVYREAFVFDCALANRKFYLPGDGQMKLQFFHIKDLCSVIEAVMERRPDAHIINVGNEYAVTVRDWVELCYAVAGKQAEFVNVDKSIEQRNYFSFYDYEYFLDVSKQKSLLNETVSLQKGLLTAFEWYIQNKDLVNRKTYVKYIEENL